MTWLAELVGQYRHQYLQKVAHDTRIFNARGARLQSSFALRLEKVYVELRLAPSAARRVNHDPIAPSDLSGSLPIWDFLPQIEGDAARPIVIVGAPGSGKSTILEHIALTLAADGQRHDLRRAYVPILLRLREQLAAISSAEPPSLAALAQAHFDDPSGHAPPPEGWFERKLRRGRCMVLLDGLGEVSPDDRRRAVVAWIEQQIADYPGSLFVVTTRPDGYRSAPIAEAFVLELQPFAADQVQRFVENWSLENEIVRASGHEDEGVQKRAAVQARELSNLLRKRPALGALSRSPLLLMLIATVQQHQCPLPGRRVDLYAEVCNVLLIGLAGSLRVPGGAVSEDELAAALEPLASHMMYQRVREISASKAREILDGSLDRLGIRGAAADSFLHDVQASGGLLVERSPERWSFLHRTLQEYLTAVHARVGSQRLPFAAFVEDAWWHETLLLHAALGDATPLLNVCLAVNSVSTLTLAGACLEEASEIDPAVRRAVEQRLNTDAESPDRERRRLTASVWLTRRAAAMRPIDARREIDLRYVTKAEYQLFIDDMRAHGELFHPDHWPHHRFLPGKAAEPVRGVRAEDAGRFTHWLSQRRGGSTSYRLPTVEEANAFPAEDGERIAAWCKNGGRYRLAGFSPEDRAALVARMRPLCSIPPPTSLSFHLVRILDLTRDRDLDLDLAIVICLALSNAIVRGPLASVAGPGPALPGELPGDLDLYRRLTLALARLRDRISSRDLTRALAHARARARDLDLDRDQTLAVALRPAFDLLHELARKGAQATLTRARAQQDQITLERACSLAEDIGEDEILAAIERRDFLGAHALASVPGDPASEPLLVLLRELLEQLRADGPPALLRAQRLADVQLVESVWSASAEPAPEAAESQPSTGRRTMAELTWWIHVIMARRAGLLPAWEGIRLVRERPLD